MFTFSGCSGLIGTLIIPDSVTRIANDVFAGCYRLTGALVMNNVTFIDDNAFINCYGLTSITFPSSVTYIGANATYGCSGITAISFRGNAPSVTTLGNYGTVFYCSNKTGFTNPFGGRPAIMQGPC
jgi:hypothetical protein